MGIFLYNTLTKRKEEFVPLKGKAVNMYTCGVTVYDECHIGHARSLYIFDVIRRYLKYRGYDVHFVRNITDIDDKIINKASEQKKSSREVAESNIASYYRDMASLGVNKADKEPKATEDIGDMIKHIQGLIDRDYAYVVDGSVYFNVRKFKDYGKLSGQSVDQMLEAVRIDKDENKKDALDFALWKRSKENEPSWESPWGFGRPGWHIECSCMSMKHLKTQTLDIHAGGRDLVFPHHENEIAQSEALTEKPFAKYWLHHGLITVNGQKMAKSLGNFVTVQKALEGFTADDIKIFFLQSHYRSNIDFSLGEIEEAHQALQRFDILFWKAYDLLKDKNAVKEAKVDFIEDHKEKFIRAMDDDFNTPAALAALFDLINATNKFIDRGAKEKNYLGIIYAAVDELETLAKDVFGLFGQEKDRELSAEQQKFLDERAEARAKKNFKRSDELRDILKKQGIAVEDGKQGQTWRWL